MDFVRENLLGLGVGALSGFVMGTAGLSYLMEFRERNRWAMAGVYTGAADIFQALDGEPNLRDTPGYLLGNRAGIALSDATFKLAGYLMDRFGRRADSELFSDADEFPVERPPGQ